MRIRTVVLVVLLGALAALAWSFTPQRLLLTPTAQDWEPVAAQPPEGMRIGVFHTGTMESQALFAYRGGGFEKRDFGMDVVVVEHPQGVLLFDAGFGRDVQRHLETVPALMRAISKIAIDPAGPVVDQLSAAGFDPANLLGVVLTHAHWDHVSGLADLPGVPVWINDEERAFIAEGRHVTALARQLGELNYRSYRYESGPYWGFPRSHDVFGDGSVVLVPAGGHTPGSTIAFIHTPDGRHYALIGDIAWQREGVELPAERPWVSRQMVDDDPAGVRETLAQLHRLQQAVPDLLIVPAHDRRVMATLPPARRAPVSQEEVAPEVPAP